MKGSSAVEANVFNDSRHVTGKASITEINLIIMQLHFAEYK